MAKSGRYLAVEGMGKYFGKLYFFKDDQYYRYDIDSDQIDPGFPQPTSAWNLPAGFQSGLDAALNGRYQYEGKVYFFKDGQYLRYDWPTDRVEDGYPIAIDGWKLPAEFGGSVDAALNGFGDYDGKAYFFKNGLYARYDWRNDAMDDGFPQPISAWKLTGDFAQQIDTAINAPANYAPGSAGKYAGKAWMFKGQQYVRYNWQTDAIDAGFPSPTSLWGLPGLDSGICWGKRVSADFKQKIIAMASELECNPDYLMAAMAFESAETFSPSIQNPTSGATGLIQFMPATARSLGTTTADLAAMSAIRQLDYVQRYFQPYRRRLQSLSDVYMVILWPKAVGEAESNILFSRPSVQYEQNKGLDANEDGHVTKAEAAAAVHSKLSKGMNAANFG
jgi:hypothetical protein